MEWKIKELDSDYYGNFTWVYRENKDRKGTYYSGYIFTAWSMIIDHEDDWNPEEGDCNNRILSMVFYQYYQTGTPGYNRIVSCDPEELEDAIISYAKHKCEKTHTLPWLDQEINFLMDQNKKWFNNG